MQDRKDQNINYAPVFFKQMGGSNLQALKNSISLWDQVSNLLTRWLTEEFLG